MAHSWSVSTVIVVLIAGVIASSQGRSRSHSENSNTNINTNHFGRRSNGNIDRNMFERRAMEHSRDKDVDFRAEDPLTVLNSGEDDASATTPMPLSSTTTSVAATMSSTKKSKKTSKFATTRRKLAQNCANEARNDPTSEIVKIVRTLRGNKQASEVAAKAIIDTITRLFTGEDQPVEKSGRSTRRNNNMNSNSNSNTNTFERNKPQKRLDGEKLGKLRRGQMDPEDPLPQIMDDSEPDYEEADSSEEDISDSVETNANTNTNINSNTNLFGNNFDDDESAEVWDSGEGLERHRRRRRRPSFAARGVTPSRNSATLEAMRRGYDLTSALRAARANFARRGENYNSNSNINEFRGGASRRGLNSRMRKRDRDFPADAYYDDNIRSKEIGGNVNSNTNINTFRRSGSPNVNGNTNYARRRQY